MEAGCYRAEGRGGYWRAPLRISSSIATLARASATRLVSTNPISTCFCTDCMSNLRGPTMPLTKWLPTAEEQAAFDARVQ